MTTVWSSNGALAVNTEDYEDISSNLDNYSDISYDLTNIPMDWHFPLNDLYDDNRWLLFENNFSLNSSSISELCYTFKNKLLWEFQPEIFLQHPLIVQKLIAWLHENKEIHLTLECLNYFVEKLIKRHYECTTGLCENIDNINLNFDSNSQISLTETNYETISSNEISRWGVAKFCISLMPITLKHICYNKGEAFSLFMSCTQLLSSIANGNNMKLFMELVFSNHTTKHILLNEPLTSFQFLIIAKELFKYSLPNEQFKEVIYNILKQPYWIHLYPKLYHKLYEKVIKEELLELQVIKMVENAYSLSTTGDLGIHQYSQLFSSSLPILSILQKFDVIDKFIANSCKYAKGTKTPDEYSNILLNLLSFKSSDIILHTYLALNKTVKKLLNNFNSESKKIDRLMENLLCTNVLNEIICYGCINSNKQVCQMASEIMEQLLKCKNTIKDDQWKYFLNNLIPIFPVLYCYVDHTSTLGQIIFNFFDPDLVEKYNTSKMMLLHSIIVMLMSKDSQCRIEANNRITWFLKTTLDKNIDLPNDIFVNEFDELNENIDEPIGEYRKNDMDDMIDLISNKYSSNQTIKCALYKLSVMLEHSHLQQSFIQNGGMKIILNLLKSSKLLTNERGLLIAILKLVLCLTKKYELLNDKQNILTNNFEIQLQLISVLSDFHKAPLVKQYISQIFFFLIFNQYLTYFGKIPKIVMDKIYTPIKINKYWNSSDSLHDTMLFSKIKNNKNCMDVLILTWNLKHYNNIDLFMENGFISNSHDNLFDDIFHNFRKASIKWMVKKYLIDLIAAKSHPVALNILGDLRRYLELSMYAEQFEVDEELLKNAVKKFLVLPPILLTDLQTLIVVLKLLNLTLKKRVLINKLNWVADTLIKSKSMHHKMVNNFENDEQSNQLCNQFFIELYEVYWLCLKNYSYFSTSNLTKLLFDQLSLTKNEFALLQVNMKCLSLLTENPKNIDKDLIKIYLSQLISLKTILMNNNSNEKSLQRNYLIILNHILHHSILLPNICEVWCIYDWETWTWSMIHSTDPLVRALVFQFSAGLAIIDIPVSCNLIHLALKNFCESNCWENCVVAEQASIFCSNIFCSHKFKNLCLQYIIKLDFNAFVQIINMCTNYDLNKSEKKYVSTSPKLVANLCCMIINMITLTELDLYELDQNTQFVHSLVTCLKHYLTPVCIENSNIMEMCGRICSILTLFIPVCNYNFENLLNSLNLIYGEINSNLDHCTTMVWRSVFKLTTKIIQCTNHQTFIITNQLISALITSVISKNNDLCIDALNVIFVISSQLSQKFAHHICKILISTLISEWYHKLKRKMIFIALSNIFIEHPYTYETARQENMLKFIISKIKIMQLKTAKQSTQKSKILQNDYLEIVGFFCNIFHGCNYAREDASTILPDLIHKLWFMVVSNPKSDMLICTIQMLISLTSDCSSACSAMTMTSSALGVDPKMKSTSYSLFHEIISLFCDFHLNGDVLNSTLLLILNCCQAQECRVIITKSKLFSNIIPILSLKDKKRSIKMEQQCLNLLLVFTSYNEGQLYILKVNYILETLIDLLKSNYKDSTIAILRNLCFNVQNRVILLSSEVFLNGIKTFLLKGNLTNQHYKDISLAVWVLACNNQKARLQLRQWGIDKYFEKPDLFICTDETQNIMNHTYTLLKS